MSQSRYRLFGRPGSGSLMVQMLLEEIGAPYDRLWVGTLPEDLATYRRSVPTGRVPALELPGGGTLFESAAICIHLAQAHPEARLAPAPGSPGNARFLQWMVYLSANIYECALRIYYADRYSEAGAAGVPGIRARAVTDYLAYFRVVAEALDPYILGADICAADHYLHVLAGWHPDGREALESGLPQLARHRQLLAARPAVQRAEADNAT